MEDITKITKIVLIGTFLAELFTCAQTNVLSHYIENERHQMFVGFVAFY